MLEATRTYTTAGPVVDNHLLAQEAMCLIGDPVTHPGSARRAARIIQDLMAKALATRATTVAELRFRLCTLLETLEHEETSEYAQKLLRAGIADLDFLSGAGPRTATVGG